MSDPSSDRTAIYALAGVIAAATIAYVATERAAKTQFDASMVQVGIGVLAADPKADVAPAREWAIDLVEKHSGQRFTAEQRETLLHHSLGFRIGVSALGGPDGLGGASPEK